MKALKAEDLRAFTQALFLGTVFDRFLLREAEFRTFCTFTVNGAAEVRWYSEEELESERVEEYTSWEKLKPLCFGLIRGKRTPLSFRLDMKLAPGDAEKPCASVHPGKRDDSGGFYLNLRFEDGALTVISAAAQNIFPPDRATEHAWDEWVQEFFRHHGLAFRER